MTFNIFADYLKSNEFGPVTASFTERDESLEIEWSLPSTECIQFSTGVWIRVFKSSDAHKLNPETSLFIPHTCLITSSTNSFSFNLPPATSFNNTNDSCRFFLNRKLIKCLTYIIEVIPNYQSFRGSTLRIEIVIPPKVFII